RTLGFRLGPGDGPGFGLGPATVLVLVAVPRRQAAGTPDFHIRVDRAHDRVSNVYDAALRSLCRQNPDGVKGNCQSIFRAAGAAFRRLQVIALKPSHFTKL